MSKIRVIWHPRPDGSRYIPPFPASDQCDGCERHPFDHPTRGSLTVDCLDGPPSQAEIDAVLGIDAAGRARANRIAADESERVALRNSSAVMAFVNMTPAEIDAWCDANITSLASAREALKTLAKIVNVSVRWLVRSG